MHVGKDDERVFPVSVERVMDSPEELDVVAPGVRFRVCAHGARELAHRLLDAATTVQCDGYRHGDMATMYSGTLLGGYEQPVVGQAHKRCSGG